MWLLVCPTVFNEAVVHRGTEQETPIDMHLINPSNIYDRFATRVFGRGMSEVRPRPLDQAAITASSDLACRVPAECRQVRQAAPGTTSSRETKVWTCVIGEMRVMPRGNAGREMNPLISVPAQCAW